MDFLFVRRSWTKRQMDVAGCKMQLADLRPGRWRAGTPAVHGAGGLAEAVADAVFGFEILGIGEIGFDFAAQTADVNA